MSETKFTPGPWSIGEAQSGEIAICADGIWVIAVKHGALYHPKGDANAHLIAAAPDLFEALRKLVAEVGGLRAFADDVRAITGNTNWSILTQRVTEADAALAKARGDA